MAKESWNSDQARRLAVSLGLTEAEYGCIEDELERVPNRNELGMFAGMWSEHCSYKSTRRWLSELPRTGPRVLAGPGSHAGVIDVGEGWAVAFKVESHNHPSAVEPYQGAATGVGGILRDVIAEGARPCAVMDALCFGSPDSARVRHLQDGIVAGIAGYGNAFGVPNVGGSTQYDPRYEGNPLVNALAAGLVRPKELRTAQARGVGNAVLYVGATTGRDGILGAAFASEELGSDNTERRSHVQVGDPFAGKRLMEACLSFGPEQGMVAGQDMGACGLTCAVTEMAAAGEMGMDVDLDAIPLREEGMSAYEILLSESQERFLFVVEAAKIAQAIEHFARAGVHAVRCGQVTAGGQVRISHRGELVVDLPAKLVAGGTPESQWPTAERLPPAKAYPVFPAPQDLGDALLKILSTPGLADLEPLYSHYDHTVGNRTVRGPGQASAAVLKLPDSRRGFALTLTGRGLVCGVDPFFGAQAALAEALRNLACVGAEMAGITDGLNCGSPRDPVENLRLRRVIEGLRDGLTELGVAVTGGNVSLYNESPMGAIPPTPMIGALGLVDDIRRVPRAGFAAGEVVFWLGAPCEQAVVSEYGRMVTGELEGPPPNVDLAAEKRLAKLLLAEIRAGHVAAARPSAAGGLGVALAKLCIRGESGAEVSMPSGFARSDWTLLGEYPAAAWVSCRPGDADSFERAARAMGVPIHRAGTARGERLRIQGLVDVAVNELARGFRESGSKK